MSNSALARLTAQYTDSENEDFGESPETENSQLSQVVLLPVKKSVKHSPNRKIKQESNEDNCLQKKTKKSKKSVKRLVSYNDDIILSDDNETFQENEEIIPEDEPDSEELLPNLSNINKNISEGLTSIRHSSGGKSPIQKVDRNDVPTNCEVSGNVDTKTEAKYAKYAHYGFSLPSEPKGKPLPELIQKIRELYDRMHSSNMNMNNIIQCRKEFRNPSIYEKLIQYCDINELGTNYPPEIYNPLCWGMESYYDELDRVQMKEMEKRRKERKDRDKIEQVSALARKVEEEAKKRKSKWDQPAGGSKRNVQGTLTTTVTGTKGTVISAFGSLPKKFN